MRILTLAAAPLLALSLSPAQAAEPPEGLPSVATPYVTVEVEVVRAKREALAPFQHEHLAASDSAAFREKLAALVTAGDASVTHTLSIRGRSGQRGKASSGVEHIYTTGVDEQGIPAHETRTLGAIFQIDAVLGPDGETVDLSLALEISQLAGETEMTVQPEKAKAPVTYTLPHFHVRELTTAVTSVIGQVAYIGALIPPDATGGANSGEDVDLVFVRCGANAGEEEK